jgi:hypothetical protein
MKREGKEKKENLRKGSGKDETRNHFAGGGVVVKSIINEIWHGNIVPQEDSCTNSPEMKELLGVMARHHEDLEKRFTDEQKEIFEKFHDCWSEYMSLSEEAIFAYAFKLGAQIMLDVLNSKDGE